MRTLSILLCGAVIATPAVAQDIKFKPIVDARLRLETAEQDGPAPLSKDRDAHAVTLRLRMGGEVSKGPFAVLGEMEGTLALDFTAAGAPVNNILNNAGNTSQLATRGGHLNLIGTLGTNSQQFNGLLVDGGASTITVAPTLTLGAITRTAGTSNDGLGTVDFRG